MTAIETSESALGGRVQRWLSRVPVFSLLLLLGCVHTYGLEREPDGSNSELRNASVYVALPLIRPMMLIRI